MNEAFISLVAAFWNCVRDDLHLRGVVSDSDMPYAQRRLPYPQRVRIERGRLRAAAIAFLESGAFIWWAELCEISPERLKGAIYADKLGN